MELKENSICQRWCWIPELIAMQSRRISPFNQTAVIIISYHFANRMREELRAIAWDLVVIDEAHKLRNAYREK